MLTESEAPIRREIYWGMGTGVVVNRWKGKEGGMSVMNSEGENRRFQNALVLGEKKKNRIPAEGKKRNVKVRPVIGKRKGILQMVKKKGGKRGGGGFKVRGELYYYSEPEQHLSIA